jgi:hypothetical protein
LVLTAADGVPVGRSIVRRDRVIQFVVDVDINAARIDRNGRRLVAGLEWPVDQRMQNAAVQDAIGDQFVLREIRDVDKTAGRGAGMPTGLTPAVERAGLMLVRAPAVVELKLYT